MGIAPSAVDVPIDRPPPHEPGAHARPVSVPTATLRALGLLAVALILILVLLPVAIVAAGT